MDIREYMELANDNYDIAMEFDRQVGGRERHLALMCYLSMRPFMQAVCIGVMPECPVEEMKTLSDMLDVFVDYGVEFNVDKDVLREIDYAYLILVDQQPDSISLMPITHIEILHCLNEVRDAAKSWYDEYRRTGSDAGSSVSELLRKAEG